MMDKSALLDWIEDIEASQRRWEKRLSDERFSDASSQVAIPNIIEKNKARLELLRAVYETMPEESEEAD